MQAQLHNMTPGNPEDIHQSANDRLKQAAAYGEIEPVWAQLRWGGVPWHHGEGTSVGEQYGIDAPKLKQRFPQFAHLFGGTLEAGKTPYGLYLKEPPTVRATDECTLRLGLSVFDENGYWRCLFPNSLVPVLFLRYKEDVPLILTKEDLVQKFADSPVVDLGVRGKYFRTYSDYLANK